MPLPDQTPKLPKIPFLVGDAALLATAWFIADRARHPLQIEQTFAIVGCVAGAAILGAIPFLTDYARRQDVALDERQRELQALARTVAASAEQISIAAQGLQEITALAQKNLKEAERLPRLLQEKMAELSRPEPGRGAEKQKAEKDLGVALSAKAERLEAVAEQIAKGAADWAKAETAFQKMVTTFEQLPARLTADEPEEPPAARAEAPAASFVPSAETAEKAPEVPKWESEPEPLPASVATEPAVKTAEAPALPLGFVAPPAAAKPPRKPRKLKVAVESEPAVVAPPPVAPESALTESSAAEQAVAEPAGAAPGVADLEVAAAEPEAPAEAPASPSSDFSQVSPDEAQPPVAVSSDGATRLLVTAYIGIGNRLFIRGDGPGLSWEKGVPLQFVSIGKWRWETADAAAAFKFKLYKNDELESLGLGESTLEPGRQQELTATF